MLAGSEITKLTIEHAQELLAMAKNSRSILVKTAPSIDRRGCFYFNVKSSPV